MNADVTVRDVMDREYVGVSESDDLIDTVEVLLREGVDTAVVLRGTEPVGVLTCRDVLALVVEGPAPGEATVKDAMTVSLPTVDPDMGVAEAADVMSAKNVRRLVVTRDVEAEPEGIITEHDVFAVRASGPESTAESTEERPTAPAGSALASEAETESGSDFDEQGICEACGTLTGDLVSFNGQLLCADCREI
jgi:CBS domain-containing protein